ncbi:MAG: 30S ribosomal protein S17e [Nanoarchaeota archaeon]|nr:30S ribosomal protein S17e [Nanoarchaeota archaeon]
MGRIKTARIKRVTLELFKLKGNEFKDNFEENKILVDKFALIKSRKIRNIIAGYVTRLKKSNRNMGTRNY